MKRTISKVALGTGLCLGLVGMNATSASASKLGPADKALDVGTSAERCDPDINREGDKVSVKIDLKHAVNRLGSQVEFTVHRIGARGTCTPDCSAETDAQRNNFLATRLRFEDDSTTTSSSDNEKGSDVCDESGGPIPVVPEAPMTILLPIVGGPAGLLVWRKTRRTKRLSLAQVSQVA